MKLLETLPQLGKYGRVKRRTWENRFLIKPITDNDPIISCDLNSIIIDRYILTYADLIADDWEFVE